MRYKVITISREFGSGGRTVGKQLAEKLGIPCYDREIIEKVAEESGYDKQYIEETGEYTKGGILNTIFQSRSYGYSPSNEDIIWKIQAELIRKLAREGPCVIVGRCADYILRDDPEVLRVFIHASMEFRAKRIVEEYGEREDSPQKRLRDKDKQRTAYYDYYTDMRFGDGRNYHLCLDSGELGIDKCVDILAGVVK
ncbi:MAG: cytidylate kinase-like family protein [Oscillospiraceae bacterium]|nr:cytidylate kinase-like family protein [Oscillospiraceae bacterium]